MADQTTTYGEGSHGHGSITIHIDDRDYKPQQPVLTGSELRHLATPAIGSDRDLYLQVRGPSDDILVGENQPIELKNGMHFITAPRTITPG